jgi:hypothetical protein
LTEGAGTEGAVLGTFASLGISASRLMSRGAGALTGHEAATVAGALREAAGALDER